VPPDTRVRVRIRMDVPPIRMRAADDIQRRLRPRLGCCMRCGISGLRLVLGSSPDSKQAVTTGSQGEGPYERLETRNARNLEYYRKGPPFVTP
jgi:hypothetical protein